MAINPDIDWIESLQKITLSHGDVVVLKIKSNIIPETLERIRSRLSGVFPDNKVLVLTGDCELNVFTKGETNE